MVTASQATTQQSIEALRVEFQKEQEETAERAAKKARLSAEVTFRKKGNERQFRFNESLQEHLRVAHVRLEEVTSSPAVSSELRQVQLAIEEGMRSLKLRQKAIKLADRSEFGWSLVAEYDADELADDSDDEKKIEKAEKAAERKAAIAKKKRGRSAQQSTGFGREAPLNVGYRKWFRYRPHLLFFLVVKRAQFQAPVSIAGSLATRRNCPKAPGGAAAASKQYPFECEIHSDCDLYDLLPVGNPDFEGQGPDAGLNGPIWELDVDEPLRSIQVHARRPQETYKSFVSR
ncbi:uncharacterized protein [Dysidea avara]|uniref:uncharacterized protein isoform X2 n=1 Tax=Dysidea avara TaxID=196820 RepID=UPI00332DE5A1